MKPSGRWAGRAAAALVEAGLVAPEEQERAARILDATRPDSPTDPAPAEEPTSAARRQGRVTEVAGYVGAALVLAAIGLILGERWPDLQRTERLLWMGGLTVVLAATAGVAATVVGSLSGLRRERGVRSHLFAVLVCLTATAAWATMTVLVRPAEEPWDSAPWMAVAEAVALATVLVAGYLVLRHGLVQLALAVAAGMLVTSLGGWAADDHIDPTALPLLGLGLLWLALAETGAWRERTVGRLLGGGMVLIALQAAEWESLLPTMAVAVATLVLAAATLGMAVWRDDNGYLLIGVLALTIGVTRLVVEVTGGSLGAGGAVLVAGLTLLAGSLLALRLRARREDPAP